MKTSIFALISVLLSAQSHAFFMASNQNAARSLPMDDSFTTPNLGDIVEEACLETANRMKRVFVPVSTDVSKTGQVGISYAYWPSEDTSKNFPPVILVHGFDSSCLEYRRLGAKLAANGIETYAVDILGWGFTKLEEVSDFSAAAKVQALNGFVNTVLGDDAKFCLGGASLGGAAAIELAAARGDSCEGLILIDAQGFVDGVGPMAALPTPLAKLGVGVLKSVPLRSSANQMSYFDKESYATEDALKVGRVHCVEQELWSDAMVSFMQSGGFSPSTKIAQIQSPSLILWGRQDGILDGEEFANKFLETLPKAELQWIEECGHVPHLEQPETTAKEITDFLDRLSSEKSSGETEEPVKELLGMAASFFGRN